MTIEIRLLVYDAVDHGVQLTRMDSAYWQELLVKNSTGRKLLERKIEQN